MDAYGSFPMALVFFQLEDGRWVDFITPPHVMYPGLIANVIAIVAVALLPLLLASLASGRRHRDHRLTRPPQKLELRNVDIESSASLRFRCRENGLSREREKQRDTSQRMAAATFIPPSLLRLHRRLVPSGCIPSPHLCSSWFLRLGQWSRAFGRPFLAGILWGIWRVFYFDPTTGNDIPSMGLLCCSIHCRHLLAGFLRHPPRYSSASSQTQWTLTPKACLKKPARLSNVQHRKSLPPNAGGGKRFHASQKSNATFSEQRELVFKQALNPFSSRRQLCVSDELRATAEDQALLRWLLEHGEKQLRRFSDNSRLCAGFV
jgi:hypothetical protein